MTSETSIPAAMYQVLVDGFSRGTSVIDVAKALVDLHGRTQADWIQDLMGGPFTIDRFPTLDAALVHCDLLERVGCLCSLRGTPLAQMTFAPRPFRAVLPPMETISTEVLLPTFPNPPPGEPTLDGRLFGVKAAAPSRWARHHLSSGCLALDPQSGLRLYTGVFLNPGWSAADWGEHCAELCVQRFSRVNTIHDLTPLSTRWATGVGFEFEGIQKGTLRSTRIFVFAALNDGMLVCSAGLGDLSAFIQNSDVIKHFSAHELFVMKEPQSWSQLPTRHALQQHLTFFFEPAREPSISITPLDDANPTVFSSPFRFSAPLPLRRGKTLKDGTPVLPTKFHSYVYSVVAWEEQYGIEDMFASTESNDSKSTGQLFPELLRSIFGRRSE